jgi:YgiT-type zinc finger domain-containing protein
MSDTIRKCYFCAGELENIVVGNFDYRLEGNLYVIKQVPASLCLQCGEKYVSGETARKIDMQIAEGNYSGTEIVRVLEFR